MKLSKRLIVGACSITGAMTLIINLTSCGEKTPKYSLTFTGENYSIVGEAAISFQFEAGKELKYELSPDDGCRLPSDVTCKFGEEIKTKDTDYTFTNNVFYIKSAPKSNISVNVKPTKVPFTSTFIGESANTYTVTSDKRTYYAGDKLSYEFACVDPSTPLLPETIHVYFDGVEQDPSTYTYTNNPNSNDYSLTAKLTINKAPAKNIVVSIQPSDKHVVYYKCVNASIDGQLEWYKEVNLNGSVTLNIKANDVFSHLPNKDGVSVYKGGSLIEDFKYTLEDGDDQSATLTINNIDNYIAIYLTADSEMLTYQENGDNNLDVIGINPNYISQYGNPTSIIIPGVFRNKTVTKISSDAFKNNQTLTSVSYIAESIDEIGNSAFEGCSNLETLPPISSTKIGNASFKGCNKLQTLSARNIKTIGNNAFEDCASMQLGDYMLDIEEIGDHAFKNCVNMSTCNDTSYTSKPLIISGSDASKVGLKFNDITKLGEGICEGWRTTGNQGQIIVFGGIWQNPNNISTYYKTEAIKEGDVETGYYKEVSGGSKTLGGSELGNITLAFTDLNLFSWEEISKISDAGLASYIWSIGDVRKNDKGSKVQYRIIGFDHDDKANGTGKAGITFETVKLGNINNVEQVVYTNTTPSSYTNSNIREVFNNDFFDSEEIRAGGLRNYIKNVSKKSIKDKDNPTQLIETNEWIFPLSYVEMGGEVTEYTQYKLEGETYDYYKGSTSETRKKMRQKYEMSSSYLLRSPYLISQSYNNKYMVGIDLKGNFFPLNASKDQKWSYSYAFCI